VGLLFSIFRWFGNLWPHYFGGSVVVTSAMVIYLLNSKMDNSAKITWMVVVAIAPVVGIPMFFYVKSNFGHNILRKRLLELEDQLRGWRPQRAGWRTHRCRRTSPGHPRPAAPCGPALPGSCPTSAGKIPVWAGRWLSGVPEHRHDLFSRRRGKV